MTLRDALATRDNALNFVRLVLAGLVIVSHTWPIGGFGADPRFGDLSLTGLCPSPTSRVVVALGVGAPVGGTSPVTGVPVRVYKPS
jgi:hypothetical protein